MGDFSPKGKAMSNFDAISDFVSASSQSIPCEVLEAAAILLLDTIGVAAGASDLAAGQIARETAIKLFQSADGESVPLMFDGRLVSKAGAAFAGATQIDNLDAHDGYNPTKGHIGCAIVPALFALAASDPKLSGREALASMVIGYEIATRAGVSLHDSVSDYHTSGAWNTLGVAAMGCRLAGGSKQQLRHALGIAEYHGPRSQMMREIATPTMLHDGSGMGALIGVMSSEMAMSGFEGAPAATVESPDIQHHWRDLGQKWTVPLNYIKPYPVCRWAHAALDAVRYLRAQTSFGPNDVKEITVRTFSEAARLFPGVPDTTSKAQYSLGFAIAKMVQHDQVGVAQIVESAFSDPQTASLLQRITILEDARHSSRFPEGRWSDVSVKLTDGRLLHSGDIHARGGPESPMSRPEILEKFSTLSKITVPSTRAEAIADICLKLASEEIQFSRLAKLVCASATQVSP